VRQFKKNKTIIDFISNSKNIYSQDDCHYLCSNLYALEKSGCGCRSNLNNFGKDCIRQFFEPVENNTKQCIAEYLKEFRSNKYARCIDYCPTACDSMSYTINPYLISNKPKTELFTIISNIGGTLGLFLGISFLSFIEIFEILFQVIYILFFE